VVCLPSAGRPRHASDESEIHLRGGAFREWHKDPSYVVACDALEDEFSVAAALIKARGEAGMTQEKAGLR
jgi:hypothetical protein